jgi:hypothetical protein
LPSRAKPEGLGAHLPWEQFHCTDEWRRCRMTKASPTAPPRNGISPAKVQWELKPRCSRVPRGLKPPSRPCRAKFAYNFPRTGEFGLGGGPFLSETLLSEMKASPDLCATFSTFPVPPLS